MSNALVVDDDVHVCLAIRALLETKGIDAVLAESAEDGFQAFDRFNFDVLLVDIFMPQIDGLKAIKVFQRQAPKIPIIAMSGLAARYAPAQQVDYFGIALKLGASCCLHKPFQAEQLLATVDACLIAPPRPTASTAMKDL